MKVLDREAITAFADAAFEDWVDSAVVPLRLKDVYKAGWHNGYRRALKVARRNKTDALVAVDDKEE